MSPRCKAPPTQQEVDDIHEDWHARWKAAGYSTPAVQVASMDYRWAARAIDNETDRKTLAGLAKKHAHRGKK